MKEIRKGDIVRLKEKTTIVEEYWDTKAKIVEVTDGPLTGFRAESLNSEVRGDLSRNDFEFVERLCNSCDSNLIHHDAKEEWICPFCETL